MNRDGNVYTFLFATIMVIVVASALSFTATSLKSLQMENVRKEKMQNILKTVGIITDRDGAESKFNTYIKKQISLTEDGKIDDQTDAFAIDLAKELKKAPSEQRFPLFIAEVEEKTYYIIPLRGNGLWDAIWGYISFKSDFNTIKGIIFDHQGETAGLGAEITKSWFQDRFREEIIFDEENTLVGITVLKGNKDPNGKDKSDHEVDSISGATITGDGVTEMIKERLSRYVSYINKFQKLSPSD